MGQEFLVGQLATNTPAILDVFLSVFGVATSVSQLAMCPTLRLEHKQESCAIWPGYLLRVTLNAGLDS